MNEWKASEYAEGFEDGCSYFQDRVKRQLWYAFAAGVTASIIPAILAALIAIAVL